VENKVKNQISVIYRLDGSPTRNHHKRHQVLCEGALQRGQKKHKLVIGKQIAFSNSILVLGLVCWMLS
jgi:hypothetical protein